jgi:hypothetical protein
VRKSCAESINALCTRQGEPKDCPFIPRALDPDAPALCTYQALCNRQTKTGAAAQLRVTLMPGARRIRTPEGFKDAFLDALVDDSTERST